MRSAAHVARATHQKWVSVFCLREPHVFVGATLQRRHALRLLITALRSRTHAATAAAAAMMPGRGREPNVWRAAYTRAWLDESVTQLDKLIGEAAEDPDLAVQAVLLAATAPVPQHRCVLRQCAWSVCRVATTCRECGVRRQQRWWPQFRRTCVGAGHALPHLHRTVEKR
jgi:hypothetical protein